MRAGFRLPAREGMARLEKEAEWLEREYSSAAASLREGLSEMITVNCLGSAPRLACCLVTTRVIESPQDCEPVGFFAGAMGRWFCAGPRRRC